MAGGILDSTLPVRPAINGERDLFHIPFMAYRLQVNLLLAVGASCSRSGETISLGLYRLTPRAVPDASGKRLLLKHIFHEALRKCPWKIECFLEDLFLVG